MDDVSCQRQESLDNMRRKLVIEQNLESKKELEEF